MRKLCVAATALTMVFALAAPAVPAPSRDVPAAVAARSSATGFRPASVPGEVIVRFAKGVSARAGARAMSARGASLIAGPASRFGVVRARGVSAETLIRRLASDPAVAYAEPNYLRYLSAIPNDPLFSDQWGLNNTGQAHPVSGSAATRAGVVDADMDVPEAWDVHQDNSGGGTVVAIMDSGVDVTHPDLAANMWVNPGEIPGNGLDDDGNGYVDDVNGWDFADDDATLLQSTGGYEGWDHGTHVAGIVGAVADNGIGIAGVCPGCKLMVLKVFRPFDTDGDGINDTMVGDIAAELKAFDYAMRMGADVVNGSFGGAVVSTRSERTKIKKAIAAGITMVFAAGNENGDNDLLIPGLDLDGDQEPDMTSPAYPATYDLPGIISVAASNDRDANGVQSTCSADVCPFTNWGHDSVDVSAPGVDIVSSLPGGGYEAFDGTSMAAPHVAGLAGLIKALHPAYTPVQVVNTIMNSVDQPASLTSLSPFVGAGSFRGAFTRTSGRADAAAALSAPPTSTYPVTDGNVAGATRLRGRVLGEVSWPADVNDVYKKKLVKGVRYRAVLNTFGSADLDLQIYKPKTKEIWPLEARCFSFGGGCPILYYDPTESGDVKVRFKVRRTGMYIFHVNAWLLNAGTYTLKVVKL